MKKTAILSILSVLVLGTSCAYDRDEETRIEDRPGTMDREDTRATDTDTTRTQVDTSFDIDADRQPDTGVTTGTTTTTTTPTDDNM